jgi:hypothetical protein
MSRYRLAVAHAVIAVLVAGSLWDVVTGREHWPFSPYAMFSEVTLPTRASTLALIGVADDRLGTEVPISHSAATSPLGWGRLRVVFEGLNADPGRQELLATALRAFLERYEALRLSGRQSGPRLARLRLYRLEWDLDLAKRSLGTDEHRTLVFEVRRPDAGP